MVQNYNKPLTFEKYLYFYHEPVSQDLTTKQLREILFIHGLLKLTNHTKEEIIAVMRSLPLIPPSRSTVDSRTDAQMISSSADQSTLSLEEIKGDIRDVNWQECPVGSVDSVICSMPDDAFLMKNGLELNDLYGLCEEDGGGRVRKRVRRSKKPMCKVPGCSVVKYADHDT